MQKRNKSQSGFTLIELSIVLVIIGLIVGGVLVGQDLIEAANRRAIVKQIEQYELAVNTFKLKYNALPGDMSNASSVLGASAGDGYGNGILDADTEKLLLWQHLGLSNLIAGNYTGALSVSGGVVAGQNVPASATYGGYVSSTCFTIDGSSCNLSVDIQYSRTISLHIGKDGETMDGTPTVSGGGIISNQAAYLIDSKVDDGIADKGRWRATSITIDGADIRDTCYTYTPSDNITKCTFGYWFKP